MVEQFSDEGADPPANSETKVGLNEHVGPAGETTANRETVPVNPRLEIVSVDDPACPG